MTDHPDPFDPAAIAGETAAFNAWLEAELANLPPVHTVPPALTRKARAEGCGVFPDAGPHEGSDWVAIPGAPGGQVRVRLSLPQARRGTRRHAAPICTSMAAAGPSARRNNTTPTTSASPGRPAAG
jgi:hypothetical protein